MAYKYVKRSSVSCVIQGKEIKAKLGYNYIPSRMAKIKKPFTTSVSDQIVFSCFSDRGVEWYHYFAE